MVYPISRTPDYVRPEDPQSESKLRDQALQPRFNSHYALVSASQGYQCMDGVRHPGVEPDYDELPPIYKSLTFNDDVAKSFTAFGKVLRARCITLREEHPNCITWPGPTPGPGPAPGGGVGDVLDGIDMGTIHPGHDMSPDEVLNFA